jgi:hypothetical protein
MLTDVPSTKQVSLVKMALGASLNCKDSPKESSLPSRRLSDFGLATAFDWCKSKWVMLEASPQPRRSHKLGYRFYESFMREVPAIESG